MTINSIKRLRPYQLEVAGAILQSVFRKEGRTFTVEIARQGGKNELSAQIEALLMVWFADEPFNLIKCSPTFKPQTVVSMLRLKEKLNAAGLLGQWDSEMGYIVRFRNCRTIFLSAEDNSNVVGNTAHLLLEVDEAQDVNEEKYSKEFKPMGSTTNATGVLYGTTWDDSTLLEKMKQTNLELERKDGVKRHFRYDWQEVAGHNPDYLRYVEGERERLGENHPLFLTQYRLLPVRGGGGFLDHAQRAQLQGTHSRRHGPEPGRIYLAGIDLAGEAESEEGDYLKAVRPRQDSTVVTIGEIEEVKTQNSKCKIESQNTKFSTCSFSPDLNINTFNLKIVEHYAWTGEKHPALYARLVDLLKNVWNCRRIAVDSTGIGQPVASFLSQALGSRVEPFTFSAPAKSRLGFNLLAAINSGRLKMYAADNSLDYKQFWQQMEKAKGYYRASRTMNFYVDQADGHDDYLMSLALLVEAANEWRPREARGR